MTDRLSLALSGGIVALPETGRVLLMRPPGGLSTEALPLDRIVAEQGFRPDFEALEARGVTVTPEAEGSFSGAIVFAARAKALTFDMLARACARVGPGGPVIVDGAKADGIDSVLKRVRAAAPVGEVYSKAHGKCFAFEAPAETPEDWAAPPASVDGFLTAPGVFSADGIDPGSALLAEHLGDLAGRVCDLGAGWGYLSARVLAEPKVTECHLVEAEHAALACARANITDPRARFHWADATRWEGGPFDVIVTNPPFHSSRKADPDLGRAFIAAAARLISPRGRVLLVANRHLPYEAALNAAFGEVTVLDDAQGYKVIAARRPIRRQA
ncbi:class I SAM-dependent methyltransferase [Jannaschia seohaensis]|uniref:16S rRNA (Guanine1207-N2)-methyltransferase n=1 Tax=Jannaschia seohaensis TaxID=475081 RepID=A0A2Y9C7T1_9RHOB|nr:class I SAM-dependent methyltransferase [Jannaschia seohaensis]PWJ18148.1 16S rRNA (guanine1207-N2)-methyltransferase [Jannaschia seohaensis]SSA46673.1 16S rRNA (guanine1207-N2)-methyltransferase [Jannaschia seohaensis]